MINAADIVKECPDIFDQLSVVCSLLKAKRYAKIPSGAMICEGCLAITQSGNIPGV
jgi:hypothetical protein